ncbi:conserved domain protein [Parasutterella excrementihominis YIT 11859]|jgi:hypothetical protein|uniref:Conserved domain protein n=1 Tax=Parasutterella excrementihominis YIT 11859 TaxID=762966 RepID=F3QJA2_9BURK|nr:hypothetical protein [Parasutterella excrementihominis]EGG55750.1 conserved domain protein [Parasutterella excrementihominis YIT 11859]DAL03683.1 MAG TPA: hypothetical protein [Caudoviricetes sp.]
MIKIKKEDFEKILALQGAKEKIYTVEEQITEVITRLRSTGFYANDCSDVDQLRAINFYLRATRKELDNVIETIINCNK